MGLLKDYQVGDFYDEMFLPDGNPRPGYEAVADSFDQIGGDELQRRKYAVERALLNMGITFQVYDKQEQALERVLPFDLMPRIIAADEWARLERGLKQRVHALNLFLDDIYNNQRIIKDGVFPEHLLGSSKSYRKQCMGLKPPKDIWIHITGTDLIRHSDGNYYVLEDNLRCPSGVAYVLENRLSMKRSFPDLFQQVSPEPVYDYPHRLLDCLQNLTDHPQPVTAVLTPGIYNSAYFEHAFLAREMGAFLVEGRDLVVHEGQVMMRTTRGLQRVDAMYRRIDDDFMDPRAFRKDSALGVPGLFEVYKNGGVALANAPGTGVADDKVVYAYVPRIIKYYLDEDPLIPNVPTYICEEEKDRKYVLEHLDELVVKAANEAGGYGMLIGPHASQAEREEFGRLIQANPREYIAQPTLSLSRVPTVTEEGIQGRHVDLRPFVLYGEEINVLPGGLTRVALRKGSLVVNSSQGGGSKDTWVLRGD